MEYDMLVLVGLILFIVITEATAQYCVKKAKTEKNLTFLLLGVFFYGFVCVALYGTYHCDIGGNMGLVNSIWSAFSILAVTSVGMYFYHEKLLIYDMVGIGFIIAGIFFIFVMGHNGNDGGGGGGGSSPSPSPVAV